MAGGHMQLSQLVDLALSGHEVGAVNFNYLRTLLLQIIKLTNNEDAVVPSLLITTEKNSNPSNFQNNKGDSILKSSSNGQLKAEVERLKGDHDVVKEKLQKLENDLESFSKLPKNVEILKNIENEGEKGSETSGEKLSATWQHLKMVQRIETIETGVDKLFSLMNDILAQRKSTAEHKEKKIDVPSKNNNELEKKENSSADQQDKDINELMNKINSITEEISALSEKHQYLENDKKNDQALVDNLKEALNELKGSVGANRTSINKNNKSLEEVKKSGKENERLIDHLQKQLDDLLKQFDQQVSTKENIEEEKVQRKQEQDRQQEKEQQQQQQHQQQQQQQQQKQQVLDQINNNSDIENLKQRINEFSKQMKNVNSSMGSMTDIAALKESIAALDKKLDHSNAELTNQLLQINSSKAEVSAVKTIEKDLNSLNQNVNESITRISEEIEKLKESITNMDNEKLKNIFDNFEQLQKMTEEIDELRKLSDLKDLADNVDSLKDLRNELDDLKNTMADDKQHSNEQNGKISDRWNAYEEYKQNLENELKKIQSILGQQQKDFVDKESLNDFVTLEDLGDELKNFSSIQNDDQSRKEVPDKGYEIQLSSGIDDLLEQVNAVKRAQANLSEKVTQLLETQTKQEGNERPPSPAFDVSVLAAIQHLAQQNRQHISALQAEINLLKNLRNTTNIQPNKNQENGMEKEGVNHLATLQEYQVQLSGQLANMLEDTKDEFNRKQKHIDALYEHIDALQKMKADKDDITSEIDVKADKQALDSKVNMSTFDERYQMLEQALQNALNRLDQFVEQEASLKDALEKLNADLDSKMDSDAEKKLKRFMEDRLKDIQKSRNNLSVDGDVISDYRNAAGLRKPMPLLYHCISCDRPVDIAMRGVMSGATQNFPAKKSLGPYTSFELDQLRQSRKQPYDRFNRPCGGQHTSVNNTLYRTQRNIQQNEMIGSYEKDVEHEDLSITDCVVGKDGQIYRGRFKPNQLPPPLPKRIVTPSARAKYHNKHRFSHSATAPSNNKESSSSLPKDETRSLSANVLILDKQSPQHNEALDSSPTHPQVNGHTEKPSVRNGSPLSLPPISRDGSLVAEDVTAISSGSLPDKK